MWYPHQNPLQRCFHPAKSLEPVQQMHPKESVDQAVIYHANLASP